MASSILNPPDGELHIDELPSGLRRLLVKCTDPSRFVPIASCQTRYPMDLIDLTLRVTGLPWLCEAISRDEDPQYVREEIRVNLFAFCDPADFVGRRILDFGCGSGASSMALAELLPQTEIVGVELDAKLLSLAEARARWRGHPNVTFKASPSGMALPADLGTFDFCMMSAVYEHLLPGERRAVLPLVWDRLRAGGILFINQTPHRYYPIETHSTRLPLINYLPDRWAFALARRYALVATARGQSDAELLRGGLRGATESEIRRILVSQRAGERPTFLPPAAFGCRDAIGLWYFRLSRARWRRTKRILKAALRAIKLLTGTALVQNLTLAIRKDVR